MSKTMRSPIRTFEAPSDSSDDDRYDNDDEVVLTSGLFTSPTGFALTLPCPDAPEFFVEPYDGEFLDFDPMGPTSLRVLVPGWVLHPHTGETTFDESVFAPLVRPLHGRSTDLKATVQIVRSESSRSGYALELRSTTCYVVQPRNDDGREIKVSTDGQVWVPIGTLDLSR